MLNQQLEHHQLQALAELSEHIGYRVLLDALQADLDDLTNTMRNATTDEESHRALREWRALDLLVGRLQALPAWALEQQMQVEVNIPDTTISDFPGDLNFSPEEQMVVLEKMGFPGQAFPRSADAGNPNSMDSV